jgi:hypothetical protein
MGDGGKSCSEKEDNSMSDEDPTYIPAQPGLRYATMMRDGEAIYEIEPLVAWMVPAAMETQQEALDSESLWVVTPSGHHHPARWSADRGAAIVFQDERVYEPISGWWYDSIGNWQAAVEKRWQIDREREERNHAKGKTPKPERPHR